MFIKRGDKMDSEQIEKFKQEIECIIKEKNYIFLRYVLFDETNRTPFAVHIFNKDDLLMVNSRDERAHVIGRTFEFDNFSEAKKKFFNVLDFIVREGRRDISNRGSYMYSSPLWDKP